MGLPCAGSLAYGSGTACIECLHWQVLTGVGLPCLVSSPVEPAATPDSWVLRRGFFETVSFLRLRDYPRVIVSPPWPPSCPSLPLPASCPLTGMPRPSWHATLPPTPSISAGSGQWSTPGFKTSQREPSQAPCAKNALLYPYLWSQRDGEGAALRSPPGSWSCCCPALAEARGTRPAQG